MLERALVIASSPEEAAPLSRMWRELAIMTPPEIDAATGPLPPYPTVAVVGLADHPETLDRMVNLVSSRIEAATTLVLDGPPNGGVLQRWRPAATQPADGFVVLTRGVDGEPVPPTAPLRDPASLPPDGGELEAVVLAAHNQVMQRRVAALEDQLAATAADLKAARERLSTVRARLRRRNRQLEGLQRSPLGALTIAARKARNRVRKRRAGQSRRGRLLDAIGVLAAMLAVAALVVLVPLATDAGVTGGLVIALTLVLLADLALWARARHRFAAADAVTERVLAQLEALRKDVTAHHRSTTSALRGQAEQTTRIERDVEQLTAATIDTARSAAATVTTLQTLSGNGGT